MLFFHHKPNETKHAMERSNDTTQTENQGIGTEMKHSVQMGTTRASLLAVGSSIEPRSVIRDSIRWPRVFRGWLRFHSKSASDAVRRLSTFYPVKVSYRGAWFPSIEHAFQAEKWLCLTAGKNRRDMWKRYHAGAEYGVLPASQIKSSGSARAFREAKVVLDQTKWSRRRLVVMMDLIWERCRRDEWFRKTLQWLVHQDVLPVHYEARKSVQRLEWGGKARRAAESDGTRYVIDGPNWLGVLYWTVAHLHPTAATSTTTSP